MALDDLIQNAYALEPRIIAWRRDFHAHPELGFQEFRTARVVAQELSDLGLEVVTGIGKTGVMAVIGEGSPVVAIRADMDALPIVEANEVEYASQSPGIMHACGHDSHTAMLLGVARILAAMPDRPAGQIRLLFQPCEETVDEEHKSGGQRMVEEGAMNGVDRVIALHVASDLPAGQITCPIGPLTASVDDFNATIIGKGCHGAHPNEGVDPIYLAAQVINALQGIRARRVNPIHPAVVTVGAIHGGVARNVIPREVTIAGTLRSYDPGVRAQLRHEVERALSVARALGGDYEVEFILGCPSVLNDARVAQTIRATARDIIGAGAVIEHEPSMGGEDFSYMTNAAPGAMFMLGAKRDEIDRPHHNPHFDLDETVFKNGTAILAETACRLLRELA